MPNSRRIPPGGTRGSVFKQAARIRQEDAKALFQARRYSGAIYLGGYAIECLLKWAAANHQAETYLSRDLETHDWDKLLSKTGMQKQLQAESRMQALYSELADVWGLELRYHTKQLVEPKAKILCNKLEQLYLWIEEHSV